MSQTGCPVFTTHVSDPMPAAVGLKVVEIIGRDRLAERAQVLGQRLLLGLTNLQGRFGCIGDVRGRELMLGIEIVADRHSKTPAPELSDAITSRCLDLGLHTNIVQLPGRGAYSGLLPPLTISEDETDTALASLDNALSDITK
ncbi:aminotransferase class III-fold pyridoxal phosphate-dependent enzyme [Paraburkholderia sp.]|uniref:aminotransferase class III-fold pyridoxal phosphate-dependent enzyme n=1 Tax=Paraburkholderia sp. TaxID=1926495 RepID=UPI003C780A69